MRAPTETGEFMGEIRGIIANDAEEKFRQLAMKKFGYGKGSLSKALEEALENWINLRIVDDVFEKAAPNKEIEQIEIFRNETI